MLSVFIKIFIAVFFVILTIEILRIKKIRFIKLRRIQLEIVNTLKYIWQCDKIIRQCSIKIGLTIYALQICVFC